MTQKPTLSIIVLNYNTKDITLACLRSLEKVKHELSFEILLVDNGSTDGSVETFAKLGNNVIFIKNPTNLGFAAGNNTARNKCKGEFVLFLNSDTLVNPGVLSETVKYLTDHKDVGVVTCKQVLPNGKIDPDSRRSFPTPWVALTHFSYLDRLFPKSKLFAKYWYGYLPEDSLAEIDVSQGAFLLIKKDLLDQIGWFSEDYFLDGEDIDLSWKVKRAGYKIIYYPNVWIHHLKKASKNKSKTYVSRGVDSMAIFYKKWMWSRYPLILNWLVILGILFIKLVRFIRTKI